jgi:aminoglycoside phosphotransferase (APT) family kinase protein
MNNHSLIINTSLVQHLISSQFPQWKHLPIQPVALSGWDNRTFHLGDQMLVRLPSAAPYAGQAEKEYTWLPKLAPFLPLPIPSPIAIGNPTQNYPWKWSIYHWLKGESAATAHIDNLTNFAKDLAQWIAALHRINPTGGPPPGPHSFHRGGSLSNYNSETRQALSLLKHKIDVPTATKLWESALSTSWSNPPLWVHGDISAGNLLVQNGQLSAVIDFGQLTIGDPACDLPISWTMFKNQSRQIFLSTLSLDPNTILRARAWTLWKSLITAANLTNATNDVEATKPLHIINEVLTDHKLNE